MCRSREDEKEQQRGEEGAAHELGGEPRSTVCACEVEKMLTEGNDWLCEMLPESFSIKTDQHNSNSCETLCCPKTVLGKS